MTAILAIDPGTTRSACLVMDAGDITEVWANETNEHVLDSLRELHESLPDCIVVIEDIEPRQQPLGREVADTLRWIGRFMEAARPLPVHLVTRRAVTAHHVDGGTKDADKRTRAALIDRWGGLDAIRKGAPLAGIVKDLWSALAIATYFADTHPEGVR